MDIRTAMKLLDTKTTDELKLKYHILSGEQSTWGVYMANGANRQFDNFSDALNYFNSNQVDAELVLYTKIGTAVTFMRWLKEG